MLKTAKNYVYRTQNTYTYTYIHAYTAYAYKFTYQLSDEFVDEDGVVIYVVRYMFLHGGFKLRFVFVY